MSLRTWLMGLNVMLSHWLKIQHATTEILFPNYVYYDIIFTFHRVIFQTYFVRNERYNFLLLELNLLCNLKLKNNKLASKYSINSHKYFICACLCE